MKYEIWRCIASTYSYYILVLNMLQMWRARVEVSEQLNIPVKY
jgi:hypothetical protein